MYDSTGEPVRRSSCGGKRKLLISGSDFEVGGATCCESGARKMNQRAPLVAVVELVLISENYLIVFRVSNFLVVFVGAEKETGGERVGDLSTGMAIKIHGDELLLPDGCYC